MDILDRYNQAVNSRAPWNNTYKECARYCWPSAQNIVKSVASEGEGQILTVDIADSTAIKAALRMTSGIFSYLMPVGVKWFEFKSRDKQLGQNRVVQLWLSSATSAVHSEIWRSNYQREMFSSIRSLVVFGTAAISVERIGGNLVYRNYHLADIFFEENNVGVVDVVFRRMFYTARQAAQEFGEENLTKEMMQCLKSGDYVRKFEIVHCVYPRKDYDTEKIDSGGKKFVSQYIDVSQKKVLKEGGFDSMPYLIGRFDKSPDELMGRSPAMELLPDIKMLNDMRYTFVLSSELACRPPLIVEDDGVIGQPSTGPGDIIYKRHGSEDPRPLQTGSNAALTHEVIQMERQGIMEGFYNDLFQALADYRNMTAYEVSQRVEEKFVMLAPAISGLQKELFDPLVIRTLELIKGTEPLEDTPVGTNLDIEVAYQGRLALAMSNMQTNAIEITLAKWAPYQQFYPVFDNINLDKAFVTSAINAGVPADHVLTEDEVGQNREEKQQMEKIAAQTQIAESASKAIKNVSGTPYAEAML